MPSHYSEVDLEARIVELENRLKQLDKKIRLLGFVATFHQPLFDAPLKRFFNAPEFWEVVYEDAGACLNQCNTAYQAAIAACDENDEDCLSRAARDHIACRKGCGDLADITFPP